MMLAAVVENQNSNCLRTQVRSRAIERRALVEERRHGSGFWLQQYIDNLRADRFGKRYSHRRRWPWLSVDSYGRDTSDLHHHGTQYNIRRLCPWFYPQRRNRRDNLPRNRVWESAAHGLGQFHVGPRQHATIGTTSPQQVGAPTEPRMVFTGWSDGGAISHAVAPASPTRYTATLQYQVYVLMNPNTGGTIKWTPRKPTRPVQCPWKAGGPFSKSSFCQR